MAILWSRQKNGVNYEVRTAGKTRRLYTDGIFHSSYNPSTPVTGGVWDMLMMPAFLYPPGFVQRVLLLGVGGGTVIRQLREFVRPREIVAVDLNEIHLDIAQRFFGVAGNDVTLVHDDAKNWVRRDRTRYELVIDDLFNGNKGEPVRAFEADAQWCSRLAKRVTNGGAVTMNCISPAELHATGFNNDNALRRRFTSRFELRAARDRNAVGMFLPHHVETGELRRNLLGVPGLNPRRERNLDFTVRRL